MFKGGVKEAAKMLQGLSRAEREKLMDEIQQKDARLAKLIKDSMVTFEDLKFLDRRMMGELLKEVSADTVGLALRGASKEVSSKVLSLVSKNIAADINDVLTGKPRMATDVQDAQEKIMGFIRPKVENGEFILAQDNDEYV